jgi:photosystem II stability/assembly factor-like uncharacterized protein
MMSFASAKVGVITSLSSVVDDRAMSILVTHDGGVSWQRQRLPLTASKTQCPCYVDRPVFLGSTHGFLVVWSAAGPVGAPLIGHLLVTSDGGGSWSPRTLPAEAQIDIGFSDPLHGWAIAGSVTDLGSLELAAGPDLSLPLYRTNDGGITWVRVPNDLQIRSKSGEIRRINFLDQNVGFLFNFPRVLKSVDGGRTWTAGGTFPPLPPPNQGG